MKGLTGSYGRELKDSELLEIRGGESQNLTPSNREWHGRDDRRRDWDRGRGDWGCWGDYDDGYRRWREDDYYGDC
jgi:hypothetical protein